MPSYTTSFPATENPLSETNRWVDGLATGLDWTNVRTTPGKAFGTQTGTVNFDDSIALLGGIASWDATQVVHATVFATNPISSTDFTAHPDLAQEVELLLRFAISGHSATGYEVTYSVNPQNPYIQFNKWNGAVGSFTLLATASAPPVIGNGDRLKATICGKRLCAYVNDVLWLEFDDTTYTTGAPGIGFYWHSTSGVGTYAAADFGFSDAAATNYEWAYAGCNLAISVGGATAGASWNAGNLSATPPAGTRVFVGVMASLLGTTFPQTTGITDATGRTWTRAAVFTNNNGTYCEEFSVWSTLANGSAITAITAKFSPALTGSGAAGLIADAFGGLSQSPNASDVIDFAQFAVDTTSPMNSGSSVGTTDRSGELKIAFYGDAGNNSTIAISTPDTGFAQIGVLGTPVKVDASSVTQIAMAFAAAGAAGVTAQVTWTSTTNADTVIGLIVVRSIEPSNSVRESHAKFPRPNMRSSQLRPGIK